MFLRFHKYGVSLLFLAAAGAAACERSGASPTVPTVISSEPQSVLATEPQMLRPEIVPGNSCVGQPAFGTRVVVLVGGRTDVRVRGLRFHFTDRVGFNTVPHVTTFSSSTALSTSPIPTPPPTPIPSSMPIPLPSTSPIPIPGMTSGQDLFVRGGRTHPIPCLLTFACGVWSDGVLVIAVDMAGETGAFTTSELRVRVGP
jgi:hypothetical protein